MGLSTGVLSAMVWGFWGSTKKRVHHGFHGRVFWGTWTMHPFLIMLGWWESILGFSKTHWFHWDFSWWIIVLQSTIGIPEDSQKGMHLRRWLHMQRRRRRFGPNSPQFSRTKGFFCGAKIVSNPWWFWWSFSEWFVGFLMDHLFFWRQGTSLDTPLNFGVYLITWTLSSGYSIPLLVDDKKMGHPLLFHGDLSFTYRGFNMF